MVEWTKERVASKVMQTFPGHQREEVTAILAGYDGGTEEGTSRVRLAILKVSGGDVAMLPRLVEGAKEDFRYVIGGAEYPNELNAEAGQSLAIDDPILVRAREDDTQQYRHWLYSTGAEPSAA